MSTVSNESQQGGNPVEGMAESGESAFNEIISGNERAPSTGQTGGTAKPRSNLPQKDASEIPEGSPANPTVTTPAAIPAARQPTSTDLIRDTIAATAAAIARTQQTQPRQQPTPRQLTPEQETAEFNKRFGVVRTDPREMAQLFDQDPAKAAAFFDAKLQAGIRQALLMAKELGAAEIDQVRSAYDPKIKAYDEYMTRVKEEAIETNFYKDHPDLADEKDLVETVKSDLINRVRSKQLTFADQASANKAVADATRKIVARMNKPSSDAIQTGGTRTAVKPAGAPVRQMSGASSPGRPGTGKAAAQSDVELVFGADAR